MTADCYFEKGHSHTICEDYALAGTQGDIAYAIVCDGCSSSEHSDLGARLQAHISREVLFYLFSTRRHLRFDRENFYQIFQELVIKKENEIQKSLGLPTEVFDATLLMSFTVEGICYCYMIGDGFCMTVLEGTADVTEISYDSGAPYYLSYELSEERRSHYQNEYAHEPVYIKGMSFRTDPYELKDTARAWSVKATKRPVHAISLEIRDRPGGIVLCSDGLSTYKKKATPEDSSIGDVNVAEVIPEILSYKNFAGEFVVRRMTAFSRSCAKKNIIHDDDIACAAINFQDP